jgi:lambda repressor-like predicted transcriptional regulator
LPLALRTAALGAVAVAGLSIAVALPAHAAGLPAPTAAAPAAQAARVDTPEAFWQAVAARVGVSPDRLQSAVREVQAQYMTQRRQAIAARLAQELGGGITADQVMAAFEQARKDGAAPEGMLAAVAKNLGVSETALKTALRQTMPRRFVMRAHGPGHRLLTDAARHLGMTPDALAAELAKGRTLAQVAAAHGKSAASLEAALRQAANARIHDLVTRQWPARADGGPVRSEPEAAQPNA